MFAGINGAGKSTALNMLSGEFLPTSGEAYLAGFSLINDVHKCRRRIGFCPQFDALFGKFTRPFVFHFICFVFGLVISFTV